MSTDYPDSPRVVAFDSFEEMVAQLRAAELVANAAASPEQHAITGGDHFARAVQMGPGAPILIFGEVWTDQQILDAEHDASGPDDVGPSDDELLEHERTLNGRGLRFGRCYSEIVPDGELGHTHVATMVPITAEQFELARAARWHA